MKEVSEGLHQYFEWLTKITPANDAIMDISDESVIACNFTYTTDKEVVSALMHIPWFIWIHIWDTYNNSHFPETVVKGMCLLVIASFFSNIEDLSGVASIEDSNTEMEVIINRINSGILPSNKEIARISVEDFTIVK